MSDNNKSHISQNQKSWDERVHVHIHSDFYDVPSFLKGKSSLNPVEINLLDNIHGLSVLHLQCHFGQDTLSLARMGAKVTGVDFSSAAIQKARELNDICGLDASFIECDIFDLPQHLDQTYDLVFTSYGTIGWLPELTSWAKLIKKYLKPGGRFVFVEFHPVIYMMDDSFNHFTYSYFNKGKMLFTDHSSYDGSTLREPQEYTCWNHSLSDIFQNLLDVGMTINHFQEYDYSPYFCFPNMTEVEKGKFMFKGFEENLPVVMALSATSNI